MLLRDRIAIITGAGSNGGPHVRLFNGATVGLELRSFFAFDPNLLQVFRECAPQFDQIVRDLPDTGTG